MTSNIPSNTKNDTKFIRLVGMSALVISVKHEVAHISPS